jgi:hypothetical protein
MRVASMVKSVSVTDLPLTALYELASPSTPPEVRDDVVERVAAGETVTAVEIRPRSFSRGELNLRTRSGTPSLPACAISVPPTGRHLMTIDIQIDPVRLELARRRRLATERARRTEARREIMQKVLKADAEADGYRRLIAWLEAARPEAGGSDLEGMLQWARAQVAICETVLDPANVAAAVRQQALFPDPDPLDDPMGEPPPHRPWGA